MSSVKQDVGIVQEVANPSIRYPQKFLPHHIQLLLMRRQQLFESLLSSSAFVIQDRRNETCEGEQDLVRLKRKIISELPEQKSTDDKQDAKPFLCPVVFNPQSRFIIVWQILNIFLIYLYFMEIPIAIAFDNHRQNNQVFFKTFNFPVIFIFCVDVFVNLNTAFYQDGMLQDNPHYIRINYFKNDLIFDVLSIGAITFYQMIQLFSSMNYYLKLMVLIFFLRMKQLLRIQRIIISSFDLNRRIKALIKLLLLLMKILLICNIVACGAFSFSSYLSDIQIIQNRDGTPCGNQCYWILNTSQADMTLKQSVFHVQYIYSLYWASTTMISIGYGDITPKNSYQITFTVVIQFLSCLLYGYSINEIWSIIQELNSKKSKIHSRLNIINLYMRDKEIGPELNAKINGYLNNYYYAKNLREREIEGQIIGELTPALKRQLYYESYSVLLKHKYFTSMSEKVIISACQNVKQVCCYEDESLSPRETLASPCLYYLKKGEIMRSTGGVAQIRLRTFYKGDYIGLFQFITQLSYLSDLTAIKYSLAYYVKYRFWREALKEDLSCFEYFYLTKDSLLLYQEMDRIGHRCFFCTLQDHRSQLCFDNKLRNIIKREYEISNKNEDNPRRGYIRRKFEVIITERRVRKQSFSKSPDFRFFKKSEINRHASLFSLHVMDESFLKRKDSMDVEMEYNLKRGGKFMTRFRTKHENQHALERIRKQYDESSQISIQQQEIKTSDFNVDMSAQYEQYYPRYNSYEFNFREQSKRRITKSFYI